MTLPPVLGFTGPARCGKDTLARFFVERHGYRRKSFADPVRQAALALDPIVTVTDSRGLVRLSEIVHGYGWEAAKDDYPEVRRTLQRLGTEVGRGMFGEDVWVMLAGPWPQTSPTVFTDCRFDNEAAAIVQTGGVVIEIIRTDQPRRDWHSSEDGVDPRFVRGRILNDGSPEHLYEQAMTLLR